MPTEGDDVIEQFAALLRRLKDRTERSYGSLARRLAMNTSTLHRYCAGEAVPQDYAPVERLAAFCGATPEERLELHRLWLLAAAARQRPRAGQGAAKPAQAEEPEETAQTDGTPEPPARRDTSRPAARPWYRRHRTAVGSVAATALLMTLGSLSALSALSADRSHGSDSAGAPARPRTTESGTAHHPSTTAADDPAPSRSPTSPSAAARTSGTHATKNRPSPRAKDDAPAPAGVPLAWTTDSQIWDGGCGHDYVIRKAPAQVPPPPVQQDAGVWAATQGAVHGRQTMVQISVQGTSSTAVVLEALRVRVVSRGTPLTGNAYAMDQGCGGGLRPRDFSVNLDVDRPIVHPRPGSDNGEPVPAVRFPYRVSAEDPEVLLVTATTEAHDCAWYLELDWSSQGRTGTARIDDHGHPFRTSGIKGLPHYWYGTNDRGTRQWVPIGS